MTKILRAAAATAIFAAMTSHGYAQGPLSPADRLNCLKSLGELYGVLRFFHPVGFSSTADFDNPTVQAAGDLNQAESEAAVKQIFETYLATFDDPLTRISAPRQQPPDTTPQDLSLENADIEYTWLDENTLLVSANNLPARAAELGGINFLISNDPLFPGLAKLAKDAVLVIFDFRQVQKESPGGLRTAALGILSTRIRPELAQILPADILVSTKMSREYRGFPNQRSASTGYNSGAYFRDHEVIRTTSPENAPQKISFVLDDFSVGIADVAMGVQAAGLGSVTYAGDMDNLTPQTYGQGTPIGETHAVTLCLGLTASVRVSDFMNADGSIGFEPYVVAETDTIKRSEEDPAIDLAIKLAKEEDVETQSEAVQSATLRYTDPRYDDLHHPDIGHRLLALYRLWNTIKYFFPYRDLTDDNWDVILERYVPVFVAARDDEDYLLAVMRLAAEIDDSHGRVNSDRVDNYFGAYTAPAIIDFVEGTALVSFVLEEKSNLKVGDIVTAVDGVSVSELHAKYAPLIPASNAETLDRNISWYLLRGGKNTVAEITVDRQSSGPAVVQETRNMAYADFRQHFRSRPNGLPTYTVLPNGFGYVNVGQLNPEDVNRAFAVIKETPGLVLDARGYPKTGQYLGWLADKGGRAALTKVPLVTSPDRQKSGTIDSYMTVPDVDPLYKGQVVSLIAPSTQSAAEHQQMLAKHMLQGRLSFVGEHTAGANGGVTYVVLPGGLEVGFTGAWAGWPDGSQLQRIGIQPDVTARQTVAAVRNGRDIPLETAISVLQK